MRVHEGDDEIGARVRGRERTRRCGRGKRGERGDVNRVEKERGEGNRGEGE